MTRAVKVCGTPGCVELTTSPHCPRHTVAAWAATPARRVDRNGRPPSGWQESKLRRLVLERDGHACYLCGAPATVADHVVPVAEGGRNHPSNMAAICHPCHAAKTKTEAARARRLAKGS